MSNEFFYLGTLTRPFGLKGDMCAFFDTDNPENYTNLPSVFLDIDGVKLPYLIERIQYRGGNQFILKIQDIEANDTARYAGTELYLPITDLPKLPENRFYFHEVIGFTVIDELKGDIGICRDFLEVGNNPLMQIFKDEIEILIPANHQFITKVDKENKILYIHAPEGLIDVYVGTRA